MMPVAMQPHALEQASRTTERDAAGFHPAAWVGVVVFYLICVISFGRYDFGGMMPFFLPAVMAAVWNPLPLPRAFPRMGAALLLALFAGGAGLFFSRQAAFFIGSVPISFGMLSLGTLLLKTLLCVFAVLWLAEFLGGKRLLETLAFLKVPDFLLLQLMLIVRYLHVLAREVSGLTAAYRLRLGGARGVDLRDAGPFLGSLLLRSIQRAQTVYEAMKLRGFDGTFAPSAVLVWRLRDSAFLVAAGAIFVCLRLVPVTHWLGTWLFALLL